MATAEPRSGDSDVSFRKDGRFDWLSCQWIGGLELQMRARGRDRQTVGADGIQAAEVHDSRRPVRALLGGQLSVRHRLGHLGRLPTLQGRQLLVLWVDSRLHHGARNDHDGL